MRAGIIFFALCLTLTGEDKVPEGATRVRENVFRHTDAQGKKWIYRRTPMGVSKIEDTGVEKVTRDHVAPITAAIEGDTVKFERPGPFGTLRWEKKKSALNESERAAVERAEKAKTKGDPKP